MQTANYEDRVALLVKLIPYVAQEDTLALKGGTAINMFVWEMPRLSVDIDLTYLPFDNRKTALQNISNSLMRLKQRVESDIRGIKIEPVYSTDNSAIKINCILGNDEVKIEVNTTMRGNIYPTRQAPLTEKAQEYFNTFAEMKLMSIGEIMGGKICAALDRQHPRDLFDIHNLFLRGGITPEIKEGFIAGLLSNNKPLSETLAPHLKDQRQAFANQFEGMTAQPFSYADFEKAQAKLFSSISSILTDQDKQLILSIKAGEPDWSLSKIERLKDLPAVQWKLQNIRALKKQNPSGHKKALAKLESVLSAKHKDFGMEIGD
jgi:predicted nucleotidyltransferase component of viral defense system